MGEQKWINLKGFDKIEGNTIDYCPPAQSVSKEGGEESQNQTLHYETYKTNREFITGKFTFKVNLNDFGTTFSLVLGQGTSPVYITFTTVDIPKVTIQWQHNYTKAFIPVASSVTQFSFKKDQELQVSIEANADSTKVFIEGMEIVSGQVALYKSYPEIVFHGNSSVSIRDINITPNKPKAFVVMEFSPKYESVYRDVILPICAELQIEVIRADEISSNTPIIADIIENIRKSSLLIAEISPDNPNVFYELGYAHAINKQVILLCSDAREKLPFDISGIRTIMYSDSISGKTYLEKN
ncbi:nucleoside 2-deoxyribosyltransferase [Vibrio algarum]|uniref:TIR domain-containing protein n=1 Tax=Vibrio algarum TaxID=3020714 RepID=A0ABT4YMU2_9VIBR|nr:nucleoside 2-deoxyribosyltransferase [Vibrio sp. KJ40-1]MDB1122843.1 hypothetical protein [Vibrio sp. KJ40-1]